MLGIRQATPTDRLVRLSEQAETHSYATVDSVQPGYAVNRSPWVTPAFLLAFAGLSILAVSFEQSAFSIYRDLLSELFGIPQGIAASESLGLRPFFLAVALLLPAFTRAPVSERLTLVLRLFAAVFTTMVLVDAALLKASTAFGPSPFSVQGQVISGILVVLGLTVALLRSFNFPANNNVPTLRRRPQRYLIVFILLMSMSLAVVVLALSAGRSHIELLRNMGLIGGIGPGIAMLAPIFNILRFCAAWLMFRSKGAYLRTRSFGAVKQPALERWLDDVTAGKARAPRVSFLVPAHNEAANIQQTVASMDRAAAHYPGECRVVVVDNNSTDQTFALAERALRQCSYLTGQVLECSAPGKSKALNMGLEHLDAEIMVRVDADTVLDEDCLPKIVMHFADPGVGGVGGLPLPLSESGWLSRVRKVEVYHNVAWNRLGQMATDSVIVVPGMLSAFRSDLVRQLGGFVEGINGEDTDMTVRAGRAGYRIVVDPDITFRTEVPSDFAHMREQRLRWSRGVFHVFTRNISGFWLRQGVRGMWMMPMSAFGFLRRALVPLLIIYALAAAVFNPDLLNLHHGATLLAVLLGPEFLITVLAMMAYRQFRLIPLVPAYFVFRLFRAYIGLEVLLSLHHRTLRRPETVDARQSELSGVSA